jgi:ABC-2 type transport system permease protein
MKRMLAMLLAVAKKELRQTVRDRRMMLLLLVAPAIQLFVFGFAVDFDVDRVPTVVVDRDESRMSREHVRRLAADGTLALIGREPSVSDAERLLEAGDAAVVLVIPEGFERDIVRGRGATVQVLVDGSNPMRANVAASTVAAYFAERSGELVRLRVSRLAALGMRAPVFTWLSVRSRVLFNPELESAVYMVPGIAAILLMLITTIVTAMGLARERERGTLEQILVTPVPSGVLISGKIIPFAAFGLFDFILALVVGSYVFDMPLHGDFVVLFAATVLYLMTTLGVGLLISTFSGSQQQAFMGGFLFMLPAALLSGIMTPVESMPDWLRPFTYVNPVRHYAEVTRGTLLRGAGLDELATELEVLSIMGVGIFTFASFRFRHSIG